eukprot:1161424-Pelagomonas_calceolata.AAC.17
MQVPRIQLRECTEKRRQSNFEVQLNLVYKLLRATSRPGLFFSFWHNRDFNTMREIPLYEKCHFTTLPPNQGLAA